MELEQRINGLRKRLQSEETNKKILNFLQNEFNDVETPVLMEAMRDLTLEISYQQYNVTTTQEQANTIIANEPQETVYVCKNKSSGKYFVYVEGLSGNELRLVNPDGTLIVLSADLFDQPKEEKLDYLFSYELITKKQIEKYNEYESQVNDRLIMPLDDYPNRIEIRRVRATARNNIQRRQTPPAYEWSRGVPELSRIEGLVTWRAICDYLKIDVGVDSARRVLKEWARINRPNWPRIPEP